MGFWNTLFTGGGLTGEFMSALGQDQVRYNDKINANNLKWASKDRQIQWTDTVKGMRNAGINPALAYQSGTASADISSQQANPEQTLNARGSLINLLQQAGGIGKTGAEIKNLLETNELMRQQQISEQVKQDLDIAKTYGEWAENILKDKQANWYDKRQAYEIKEIGERIANITSGTILNQAKKTSEVSLQGLQDSQRRLNEDTKPNKITVKGPFGVGVEVPENRTNSNNSNNNNKPKKWVKVKRPGEDYYTWERR